MEKIISDKLRINTNLGTYRVAEEVITSIAGAALAGIPGVADLSGGIADGFAELLGKKSLSKGIKVSANDQEINLQVYLVIEYGHPIPKVVDEVQQKIKDAVESLTGLVVKGVHVDVVAVNQPKTAEVTEEAPVTV